MKKILIVNKSFEVGGIQSSMINMANELSKYYEVDLFIYNPFGPMRERLNEKVGILEPSWRFRSLGTSLKECIKTNSLRLILFRLFAMIWTKLFNNKLPIKKAIKHQKKLEGYDLAIAFHQEQRRKSVISGFVRFVDKCVKAKKKVAWLHFDSKIIDLDSQFNNPFYQKMDKVMCISKSLMENFLENNACLRDKVDYCYNFMEYDAIKTKSLEKQEIPYPEGKFICFSACRLTEEKALVRAIQSLGKVIKENQDIAWYIAGDGIEKTNIENAIKDNGLNEQIILIGNQNNPYSYMRNADLVMNVSYHEATPMVYFEAKALGTPIFATKTSSSEELLKEGEDSFICENFAQGIYEKFDGLIKNRNYIVKTRKKMKDYSIDNQKSLVKIQELLD